MGGSSEKVVWRCQAGMGSYFHTGWGPDINLRFSLFCRWYLHNSGAEVFLVLEVALIGYFSPSGMDSNCGKR